jgi:putative colanic acid biosynthesis UDP-glucose lipid carrier transferase
VAKKLAFYLEQECVNIEIIGFIEDANKVKELSYYPIYDEMKNVVEVSRQMQVSEIFSTICPEQNKSIYSLMLEAEAGLIRFRIVPDFSFFIQKPFYIDYLRNLPVLSLRREPLDDLTSLLKKKIIDIVISSIVSVFVLSWLIPILGALIYLDSPGPIFFSQVRTGRNNRNFRCLKFRSMKINDDSDNVQATHNDSRVTRIGKFIRRTSLDEFPQFINVLRGEMSVVGPRPHMIKHTEIYSKVVNEYMIRQFLKPGITGWAQINGFRGEITNKEQIMQRVQYDLWYLENWSVWLDIKILFLTVFKILKGEANVY